MYVFIPTFTYYLIYHLRKWHLCSPNGKDERNSERALALSPSSAHYLTAETAYARRAVTSVPCSFPWSTQLPPEVNTPEQQVDASCQSLPIHSFSDGLRWHPVVSIRKVYRHGIPCVFDRLLPLILALLFGQVQDSWGNTFFPWGLCEGLVLGVDPFSPRSPKAACPLGGSMSSLDVAQYWLLSFKPIGSSCTLFMKSFLKSYLHVYLFIYFVPVFQLSAPGIPSTCSVSYLHVLYPSSRIFADFHLICSVSRACLPRALLGCQPRFFLSCSCQHALLFRDDFSFSSASFHLLSSAIAALHIFWTPVALLWDFVLKK